MAKARCQASAPVNSSRATSRATPATQLGLPPPEYRDPYANFLQELNKADKKGPVKEQT